MKLAKNATAPFSGSAAMRLDHLNLFRRGISRLRRSWFPLDGFLRKVPGVIHIGANTGQESSSYASLGLNVIWIEPIPSVFEQLVSNIATYPQQKAYRCLLTDQHGKEYEFHVANNEGASSSIFEFARHTEIWPDVRYAQTIQITATTLSRLVSSENVNLHLYGALVLDTQGSELLVLKGGASLLDRFRFIKTEAADFEAYAGCCQLTELTQYLREHQFVLRRKYPFAWTRDGGTYYDVLYERNAPIAVAA